MYKRVNSSDPDDLQLQNSLEFQALSESKDKNASEHFNNEVERSKTDDVSEGKNEEKIPYPKSVFFIVSNEFCERFSFYGMRTVLSLYLKNILLFSESDSTIIYHIFTMLAYFFPVLGAIIADSWLGKYRTIMYVSLIYASGNILLALSSAEPLHIPQVPFSLVALLLIAIGTGGIKPCVAAFGGDQFVVPQQAVQLAAFFSVFYFSINAGSLISTFLTPILREDVHCFGEESCFPLAFAVPGILMIVAFAIFLFGTPLYKIRKPEGNVVIDVVKCISYACKKKFSAKDKVDHWLDRSEDKFDKDLIKDIKGTLKVLLVFIPLPIFYTLYDQQGSGWTFQAVRMKGDMGSYTILPDQMQVINPALILIFIPLFTYGVYPLLNKINILNTPLQRMACGGFLVALSFGVSAGISAAVESTYPDLPTNGICQLRVYNPYDCEGTLTISSLNIKNKNIAKMGYEHIDANCGTEKNYTYTFEHCLKQFTGNLKLGESEGYVLYPSTDGFIQLIDDISKPEDGYPKIRTLVGYPSKEFSISYYDEDENVLTIPSNNDSLLSIDPSTYKINKKGDDLEFALGGVYTVLVESDQATHTTKSVKSHIVTEANSVHILWQVPQYVIITAGEILFSITGYEFSYQEAPVSMKSVLQAAFLLTSAVGNLIIIIIESAKIFDRQSLDFTLYTAIMVADMFLFAYMATKYKYVKNNKEEKDDSDTISKKSSKELE